MPRISSWVLRQRDIRTVHEVNDMTISRRKMLKISAGAGAGLLLATLGHTVGWPVPVGGN